MTAYSCHRMKNNEELRMNNEEWRIMKNEELRMNNEELI